MTTPTPRVDAQVDYEIRTGQSLGESAIYDLARQLERDLAARDAELAEWKRKAEEAARDAARYRHHAEEFQGVRGIWLESSESDFMTDEETDAAIAAKGEA